MIQSGSRSAVLDSRGLFETNPSAGVSNINPSLSHSAEKLKNKKFKNAQLFKRANVSSAADSNSPDAFEIPQAATIEQEQLELARRNRRKRTLKGIVFAVIIAAALAAIVSILFFPVIRIYGNSMTPTLNPDDVVITMKGGDVSQGDVVGVNYGNKVIIKRCIATEGQWVNIDQEGNVYVDGVKLDEPYASEKALGDCNIILPYQVPANSYFVMGDHRETSIDSRNTSVGCITQDNIAGKILFCIWPLSDFGPVK